MKTQMLALALLVGVTTISAWAAPPSSPAFAKTAWRIFTENPNPSVAVRQLLAHGISVNQRLSTGAPLLCFFATDPKISKLLLKHGADVNEAETSDGDTPLMGAIYASDVSAVKLLLTAKPDLSREDNDGDTALNIANDMIQLNGEGTKDRASTVKNAHIIADLLTSGYAPLGDHLKSLETCDGTLVARVTSFTPDGNDTQFATITGKLTNYGGKHYDFVEIKAKFLNDSELIDTGIDNVQALDTGETWDFTITTLKSGSSDYALTSITTLPPSAMPPDSIIPED